MDSELVDAVKYVSSIIPVNPGHSSEIGHPEAIDSESS